MGKYAGGGEKGVYPGLFNVNDMSQYKDLMQGKLFQRCTHL